MENNNEQPVKRGRGRPPKTPEQREEARKLSLEKKKERELIGHSNHGLENLEPGDNTKFLAHAMEVAAMPKIDITDVAQVEARIHDYFALCVKNDVKPSATGFRNAIGVAKSTISVWRNGVFRKGTHQEVICRGYSILEALWEDYMLNGKINPVSGIFLGKANFGIVERQEVVVTPNTGAVEAMDLATIEAKYAELPDIED